MASSDAATAKVAEFHRSLPGFRPTPLIPVASLAQALGAGRVFVKHERERLGLPSFKVLGASWAINCEVARLRGEPAPTDFEVTRRLAAGLPEGTTLSTATEGNHGHGVAHVARLLGLGARIYVPAGIAAARVAAIAAEGATVVPVAGSYDDTVRFAAAEAEGDVALMLVSDTSWPGYEAIPRAIGAGYATVFAEAYAQLADLGGTPFDLAFVPAGVGALAGAAVVHIGARGGSVVTVEPTVADCVRRSLDAGEPVAVPGPHDSVMAGLNCGEISRVAWPILRDGLHAAVAVDDTEAIEAMRMLAALDLPSGASGAAALAGALALTRQAGVGSPVAKGRRSVLLLDSEGVTDPESYAALVNGPS